MSRPLEVVVHQHETLWALCAEELEAAITSTNPDVVVRLDLPVLESERLGFTAARNRRRALIVAGNPIPDPEAGVRPESQDYRIEDALDLLDAVMLRHPGVAEHVASGYAPDELAIVQAPRDEPPKHEILEAIQAGDDALRSTVEAYLDARLAVWQLRSAAARRTLAHLAEELGTVRVEDDRTLRVLLALPVPLIRAGVVPSVGRRPAVTYLAPEEYWDESQEDALMARRLRDPSATLDPGTLDRLLVEWFLDEAESGVGMRPWWYANRSKVIADGIASEHSSVVAYLRELVGDGPVPPGASFVVHLRFYKMLGRIQARFGALLDHPMPYWLRPPALVRLALLEALPEASEHPELRTPPAEEEGDAADLARLGPIALELTARLRSQTIRARAAFLPEALRADAAWMLESFVTQHPVGIAAVYGYLFTEELPPVPKLVEEATDFVVFAFTAAIAAMVKRSRSDETGACSAELRAALDALADRACIYAYEDWPEAIGDSKALPARLEELASAFVVGAVLAWPEGVPLPPEAVRVRGAVALLPEAERSLLVQRYARGTPIERLANQTGQKQSKVAEGLGELLERLRVSLLPARR